MSADDSLDEAARAWAQHGVKRAGAKRSGYAILGFSDKANLDESALRPVAFALKVLTATKKARIGALVKKAVS